VLEIQIRGGVTTGADVVGAVDALGDWTAVLDDTAENPNNGSGTIHSTLDTWPRS